MAMTSPALVEAPPRLGRPFGLFSVLSFRPIGDGRWQNGIEWQNLGCPAISARGDDSCDPDTPTLGLPKARGQTFSSGAEGKPFAVYGTHLCSPVGYTPEESQEIALASLLAGEEAVVEEALWTGSLGNSWIGENYLGTNPPADANTLLGTSPSIVDAIGAIEAINPDSADPGVFHMAKDAAVHGLKLGVIEKVGNRLQTALGTPVIAGAGYPGTTPAGTKAPGTSTIWHTPQMVGYRSEPFPGTEPASAGLNLGTNDMWSVAERSYVIGFDHGCIIPSYATVRLFTPETPTP